MSWAQPCLSGCWTWESQVHLCSMLWKTPTSYCKCGFANIAVSLWLFLRYLRCFPPANCKTSPLSTWGDGKSQLSSKSIAGTIEYHCGVIQWQGASSGLPQSTGSFHWIRRKVTGLSAVAIERMRNRPMKTSNLCLGGNHPWTYLELTWTDHIIRIIPKFRLGALRCLWISPNSGWSGQT